MIKLVIFDLDGVLADTLPLHWQSYTKAFAPYGVKPELDYYARMMCIPTEKTVARFAERYNVRADTASIAARKHQLFHALLKNVKPVKGAVELVKALKKHGFRLAVTSNAPREEVSAMLAKFGIEAYFDSIVTLDDVKNPKPSPEMFRKVCHELGIKPGHALVIEDGMYGIQGAKQCGMHSIGLRTKFNKYQDFSAASMEIKSLGQLDVEKIKALGA